jgi:putative addiction module component (TIGR02574 family)
LEEKNQASATRRIVVSFGVLSLEVQKYVPDSRIQLAYKLLQSVDDEEDPEYERLVMKEVRRRLREIDEGKTKLIPGEQFFAELQAELSSMKQTPERQEKAIRVRSFKEINHDAFQLPDCERLDLAYAILRDLESEGFQIDWERPEVIGRSRESFLSTNETP